MKRMNATSGTTTKMLLSFVPLMILRLGLYQLRFATRMPPHAVVDTAVELAKDWRSDRVLRRLEALLAVTDREHGFIISGTGDIIEPDDGILAIGSGGSYALAAARALVENTDLPAREIVRRGLEIAAEICVYTNANITVLEPS